MLNLTFREISLLSLFLNNDLLSITELKRKGGVSARTLNYEFAQINKILLATGHKVKISNQRGKGYELTYPLAERDWINSLQRDCAEYLNLRFTHEFADKLRIARILRFLCTQQGYIKVDQLAKRLNFSVAVINKDMSMVRAFLEMYDIKIKSVPYHGMKLIGSVGAIRSCLIDLFDVYDFYSTEALLPEYAFSEYGLKRLDLLTTKRHLQKVIDQNNFPLTDAGFRSVIKYLLIYKLRPDIVPHIKPKERQELVSTKAFVIAQQLIKQNLDEQLFLAIFLLINVEIDCIPDLNILKSWSQDIDKQEQLLLKAVHSRLSLDISPKSALAKYIYKAFFIRYLKKKYQLAAFNVMLTHKKAIRKLFASLSLVIALYNFCSDYNKLELADNLFDEIVLGLYVVIHHEKNEYFPTSFLIINDYGKLASKALIHKLDLNEYNVSYTCIYSYELADIDYTKYDYLLVSSTIDKQNYDDIPIPKIMFSFFLSDQLGMDLWQRILSTKRKIGSIANYMKNPILVELSASRSTLLQKLTDKLVKLLDISKDDYTHFSNYITALIASKDYSGHSFNMHLTLLGSHEVGQKYFVFKLDRPVKLRYRKIVFIKIVVLDLSKGLLEIKNGDSELQPYFNFKDGDENKNK